MPVAVGLGICALSLLGSIQTFCNNIVMPLHGAFMGPAMIPQKALHATNIRIKLRVCA
jgi:hypothetical protein